MKRLIKFLLSLAIGLAIFLIVMQRVGLGNIKYAFTFFWGIEGLIIVLLTFLMGIFAILKWKFILKTMGYPFSIWQVSPLWLLGFAITYLTPFAVFGGEIFRIYFTKKKFPQVPVEKNMASVAIDKILDATIFFFFLIVGLLVFAFYGRFPTSLAGISVLLIAGGFLALLVIFYCRRVQKKSVLEWFLKHLGIPKEKVAQGENGSLIFEAEKEVFRFFSIKQKSFWKAFSLTVLRYGAHFMKCLFLVFFLSNNIAFLKALAVYGFVALAGLTPLPATLGALELGQGFAFGVLGLGFDIGTIFSMIWRSADLILCLFGLIFLIKFTTRLAEVKLAKILNNNEIQRHNDKIQRHSERSKESHRFF